MSLKLVLLLSPEENTLLYDALKNEQWEYKKLLDKEKNKASVDAKHYRECFFNLESVIDKVGVRK